MKAVVRIGQSRSEYSGSGPVCDMVSAPPPWPRPQEKQPVLQACWSGTEQKDKIRRGSAFVRFGHQPTEPPKDLDTPIQGQDSSYPAPGLGLL